MKDIKKIDKFSFESMLRRLTNENYIKLRDKLIDNYFLNEKENKYELKNNSDTRDIPFIMKLLEKNKNFDSLSEIADYMKKLLIYKKKIIIFAYNKTGKTRLSYEFKSLSQEKDENDEKISSDTLYYNAFTEDLFFWDNDIYNDTHRVLMFNKKSKFFKDFQTLNIDTKAREILYNFADFDFTMNFNEKENTNNKSDKKNNDENNIESSDNKEFEKNKDTAETSILNNIDSSLTDNLGYNIYDYGYISFYKIVGGEKIENIKISRGEQSIFILCIFLAIVELIITESSEQKQVYEWVENIYIDDPVSSLDDEHIIKIAVYIANLFKKNEEENERRKTPIEKILPVIVSTHHTLFYNIMYNEWYKKDKCESYFLTTKTIEIPDENDKSLMRYKTIYNIKNINDTPFFYHVAMINKLVGASKSGQLFTYHFAILRSVLEKTASFFGYTHFQECLKINEEKQSDNMLNDEIYYKRAIQALNHGGYSLFEPVEMMSETKNIFSATLTLFLDNYKFNIEKEIIEKEDNNGK